jgi:hypothetical protein
LHAELAGAAAEVVQAPRVACAQVVVVQHLDHAVRQHLAVEQGALRALGDGEVRLRQAKMTFRLVAKL